MVTTNTLYTHQISWIEYHPFLEMDVKKGFPTTKCALPLWLHTLKKDPKVRELTVVAINQS